ncbi:uncharacterized protein BDW43DRAFT_71365 [Aspergillus alliaceus]|uniref:uncharacterized protein n=1 Tax=Petromyces alliaceus TaxID=209559 RepID=UPI0012A74AC5|nr:uncharacterized protein BDW43DRAFT_71365 [Aspergillus alliaceus]KAB8238926.1 hypothetical protein BDW43DRAFT_71365 [Aspergillus alliaceus]
MIRPSYPCFTLSLNYRSRLTVLFNTGEPAAISLYIHLVNLIIPYNFFLYFFLFIPPIPHLIMEKEVHVFLALFLLLLHSVSCHFISDTLLSLLFYFNFITFTFLRHTIIPHNQIQLAYQF